MSPVDDNREDFKEESKKIKKRQVEQIIKGYEEGDHPQSIV